ncbi:CDF family Co(II)/Ni(II) efflux transporter DmeF [Stenotrophomonas sp. YIM B06876]|uniref:CDF family Co(II)/Ni(II) efflux transporter DmeF n=1 Tax=Stenotrophomonas sp. YIM B06876 TaxID=3060211 RepID=UPI0027390EA6|nr:CDF family Co(II)/Ni(II) efflux transporter DmeF [Stenotrophomonas sp. YIM B06876]
MNLEVLARSRQHSHAFSDGNPMAEKSTRRAMLLTTVMMVVEIVGGWWFNSMAVLADGWHMSSHALALGLAAFAYACARHYRDDPRFAFGTWKIEILAGYTSAILLLGVAAIMVFESIVRMFKPSPIHYQQAIVIAVIGLAVNLLCAWWLRDHPHEHGHGHAHGHHGDHHHHHDLNQRSAYLHVMADAATSVLAIIALLGGLYFSASWLDPLMGIVGAVLVSAWAYGLIRQTGRVLLDAQMDAPVVAEIREAVEQGGIPARISDLHVWQVGRGRFACAMEVVAAPGVDAEVFRRALSIHEEIVHVTVEVVEAG